jgi:hypothetical protein
VRPAQHAAPLELVEVAARRHRRDAEPGLDVGDRDRAVRAERLGDRQAARLGEQRAPVSVDFLCVCDRLLLELRP